MSNKTLLVVAVVVVAVGVVAYAMGHQKAADDSAPQGVLGNAAAAVSDKITQVSDQSKADADKQSASDHADAAKAALGINK